MWGIDDVEDHDLVGHCAQPLERLAPVGCMRDLVALQPQRSRQRGLDGGLVVDD